jgi:mannose-6-phosphate isomerase-like protein (cupin superfamily)
VKNDIERRKFILRAGLMLGGIGLASMAVPANAQTDKERKKAVKYLVRRVSEVPKERSTCGYRQRMITKDDCDKACFTFLNSHAAGRHHHNKTTEFYYVLKGNGALELDGDRVEAYRDSFNDLPGNKQACETTVTMYQSMLLAERSAMDDILEAIRKIRAYSAELAKKA